MKRLIFLFPLLIIFSSCSFFSNNPDDSKDYVRVEYSNYVKENYYEFPEKTDSITLYNCFINEYGYGEKNLTGVFSHTETAVLNGHLYSDTITKNIVKFNMYTIIDTGLPSTSYYIEFTTDSGEKLTYVYQWQFKKTNIWKNDLLKGSLKINK